MLDRIQLTGLEVFAHHGVFDFEKRDGQNFIIDVTIEADLSTAAATDDLNESVDYGTLANRIVEVVRAETFDLIESVAARVANVALEFPRTQVVHVTVHKPSAPIDHTFRDVSVSVTRSRA